MERSKKWFNKMVLVCLKHHFSTTKVLLFSVYWSKVWKNYIFVAIISWGFSKFVKINDFLCFFCQKVIISPRSTNFLMFFVFEIYFENTTDSFIFKLTFVDILIKIMLLVSGKLENRFLKTWYSKVFCRKMCVFCKKIVFSEKYPNFLHLPLIMDENISFGGTFSKYSEILTKSPKLIYDALIGRCFHLSFKPPSGRSSSAEFDAPQGGGVPGFFPYSVTIARKMYQSPFETWWCPRQRSDEFLDTRNGFLTKFYIDIVICFCSQHFFIKKK